VITDTRWDPDLYFRFSDHRLRPALELLARVSLTSPRVVYDLGCGAGEMARLMAERWPDATVFGLDSSREMLEKAAATPSSVRWIEADLQSWTPPEPPDLLYSNATFHWVDRHEELFPRLLGFLCPGGSLAVQMPLSHNLPSHHLMGETLADLGMSSDALAKTLAREWILSPEAYYDLLAPRAEHVEIWETEYLQVLEGTDPVLEWVKGTGLRPVLNGLVDAEREIFLAEYTRRLRAAYTQRADGKTLYPFRRLFLVAMVPDLRKLIRVGHGPYRLVAYYMERQKDQEQLVPAPTHAGSGSRLLE
jgi:trans-aconitate 2-methyltransferase